MLDPLEPRCAFTRPVVPSASRVPPWDGTLPVSPRGGPEARLQASKQASSLTQRALADTQKAASYRPHVLKRRRPLVVFTLADGPQRQHIKGCHPPPFYSPWVGHRTLPRSPRDHGKGLIVPQFSSPWETTLERSAVGSFSSGAGAVIAEGWKFQKVCGAGRGGPTGMEKTM